MLISEIQNVYKRALALERRVKLSSLFPEGIVPYMQRLYHEGTVASTIGPFAVRGPSLTNSFIAKCPLELYPNRDYTLQVQNSMLDLGKMDGYAFSSSIPKFDPWFRTILKEKSPQMCQNLEDTFIRDPCTPERVMKHLALFDRSWKRKPTGHVYKEADRIFDEMFAPVGKVEPIDFNYAGWHEILPHLDMTSSPGLPLRREYHTQGECLGLIYDKAKRLNHFAKFLPPPAVRAPPCMIGLRPGLLKIEDLEIKLKARGVWAYPAEVKVMEMRYVVPLLKRFSSVFNKIPYPVGRNMTKALPMLIDHLLKDGQHGLVTDISKLDTSVGPDWIDWAFSKVKRFFYHGMTKSSEERNSNVLDFLHYYFKRTPILFPSGQLVRKTGGVPSGSGFTQIIDTFVVIKASIVALLQMGVPESQIKDTLRVVGDDMAVSVPPSFSVPEFCWRMERVGFDVNPDKVMFSGSGMELKFLGYSKYGGGIYRPIEELLQTAFFPEKYVGSAERSRQRILGQTIASGLCNGFFSKCNYWMEELVNYQSRICDDEIYIPQRRWMRNVLGLEELPSTTLVFDLYHLC